MNAPEPKKRRDEEAAGEEENREADTAPGPQGDHLPSDKPHQVAEEELNPHYGVGGPDRSRGD